MTLRGIILLIACTCDYALSVKTRPCRIYTPGIKKVHSIENAKALNKAQFSTVDDSPYRLPNTTRPVHYNLWWKLNLDPPIQTLNGTVNIDLQATKPNVDKIVIHSYNLTIDSLKLTLDKKVVEQAYTFDLDHQFLIINLKNGSLKYNAKRPINYTLSIAFNAPMRTDMTGIYRSWFLNFGKIHWMAATQFEETSARTAFPCYDEPALKATFDITITRQEKYKSWSNMMRKETKTSVYNGYENDVYYTTPVMSTYLVALIVAEFDSVAKVKKINGKKEIVYEIIGRPDAIRTGQGDYIFELGQSLLDELVNYTGIDYYSAQKHMKLTHAAIPNFMSTGMENWGLITYKEYFIMYNEESSLKSYLTKLVTHETSHAWFGNLVTLDWWDVTWLNEGFATYFEYFITDKLTDMAYATRFIDEQVQVGLHYDSFDNPTPLSNTDVGSPSEIDAMFSTLSYSKGGSIIKMTEHLMGYENHKLGLRKYLKARAYKSARPIDLFENLQKAAVETGAISQYGPDFNIIDYYKTWTEQGGHPILDVTVDRQTGAVTIQQRQFNMNGGYTTPEMNWFVPITFATARNPDFANTKPSHIIKDANTTLHLGLGTNEWIIFNVQQSGFYRVNYDNHSWDLIIELLRGPNRDLIHPNNRAQIVYDVFIFARSGIMSYNRAFNILSFLKNETTYGPLIVAYEQFGWLINKLRGSSLEKPMKNLFMEWTSHVMANITYLPVEGESFLKSNLRLWLSSVLCRYGKEECVITSRRFLLAHLSGWVLDRIKCNKFILDGDIQYTSAIPVSIRPWVYCSALRDGNSNHYNFLFNRLLYHPVNAEQLRLIDLLGCTTNESSLFHFLDTIFKQNFTIQDQNLWNAYGGAVDGNDANVEVVFRYIQQNLQAVASRFDSVSQPLSYIATAIRTEDLMKRFQDWATQNKEVLGDSYQDLFDSAGSFRNSQKWAATFHDDINSYLIEGDKPVSAAGLSNVALT
ncbi:hypothetical protein ACJJTC_018153 [Scirpophaga incertulas]